LKRSAFLLVLCSVAMTWFGCGGGSDGDKTSTNPNLSHVKDRVFVTNFHAGIVHVIDATKNQITATSIQADSGAGSMVPSPDGKSTLVLNQAAGDITPITNSTEFLVSGATSQIAIGGFTESVALASDNKTGYAAVRNFNNGSGVAIGAVQKFDYTTAAVSSTIPVPAARWLALNHAGTKLLVMSDTSDSVMLVDLTATTPAPTTLAVTFSRPVAAFFSADDSKAYVLNCGPECGGTQASVSELNTTTNTITRTVNLSSARVATMSGTTMYVAGSPSGSGGTAQTVDLSAFTAGAPVNVGAGQKSVIKFLANKVWIGSINCGGGGCLSLWDPAGTSVTVDDPAAGQLSKGDVTGMDLITSSNRMFVAEGGELRVYDTNLKEEITNMDIFGRAYDVLYVPQ
jgi:DNA-binding beta-propeller fold protein YncE